MPIVRLIDGSKKWVIDGRGKIKEILNKIGLLTEEYIIVKNGKVVTPEDIVEENDEIILYPVVSGG